ncbi:hypothetical protein PCANC_08313 [Puccinia coronata f. sp. avenae]|uniref:Helitron helicase-like domain-containing protein n=1 Tax=Puccinia coronata f. sp. avenae TaxID=200324 RepID=A0A2N5T4N3_9BASI|nr:hypothetical protein PCANC_08313 [Puccinia coronata f. sp. avenae]
MYNNSISFTSLGANIDRTVKGPKGVNIFRISGGLTHLVSSIEPDNPQDAGFSQIYVVGNRGTEEAQHRIKKAQGIGGNTGFNPYAKTYKLAVKVLEDSRAFTIALQGISKPGCDPKRYNEPTLEEVAVVVQGKGDQLGDRQIALHRKEGDLEIIPDSHSSYFPLCYPIFFPFGSQQWDNLYQAWTTRSRGRRVNPLEWYAYMLFKRPTFSPILAGRSLLQEFVVDAWVVVERSRLQFIKLNQDKMKAQQYQKLVESIKNEAPTTCRRVILPSSFIGGPRAMSQLYQDSMAICKKYGPPHLFITMTANPDWPEIRAEIPPGDKAYDHPTVTTRIFHLKAQHLIFQLTKMRRLGTVIAYVYTIEYQKRGLPQMHLMVTLDEKDRPNSPEKIDLLVSAELPDKATSPVLYALVTKFNLHGPCETKPCWNGSMCKSGFPKPYTPRTFVVDGAYPAYRRRDDGRKFTKFTSTFTNQHVVPFNKFLTLLFECHINVKVPVNSTAIKYLYKYITKGHDRSYMKVEGCDETKACLDARYVSPPEAAWRLFKFPLSGRFPAVTRLALHYSDEQMVYFNSEESTVGKVETGTAEKTSLTGFFKLNIADAVGADNWRARSLGYKELPTYFWWDKEKKEWQPRKSKDEAVGRVFLVSYLAGERFYP